MKSEIFVTATILGLLILPVRAAPVSVFDEDNAGGRSKNHDLYVGIEFIGGGETALNIARLGPGGFSSGLSDSGFLSPHRTNSAGVFNSESAGSGNGHSRSSSSSLMSGLLDHEHLASSSFTLAFLDDSRRVAGDNDGRGSFSSSGPSANDPSGVAAAPLPSALPLFMSGLVGIALALWRKGRKGAATSACG